jgi:putative Holliday junction resolvase
MYGRRGPRAQKCEDFARRLAGMVDVPVALWDERGTTVSAIGFLNETDTRGKKRKEVVDEVAATIILESYLNYRKNHT